MDMRLLQKKIKSSTIFQQLILNVIIPVVLALIILAALNYHKTQRMLSDSNSMKNYLISDEIRHILEFQDVALEILSENIDKRLSNFSTILVDSLFRDTKNIEKSDLEAIHKMLGMESQLEDIYVINMDGIVVNTTFNDDLGLNFFDFGEDHKNYLLKILNGNEFVSERFAIEKSTKRLKKYTYQPTRDKKYIIELGSYSHKADEIISFIENTLKKISGKHKSIISIDLFIGEDNPFSLNKGAYINNEQIEILKSVFKNKDTSTIKQKENGRFWVYEYIYMERKNTDLYKSSIIRIVSDRTDEATFLRWELLKALIIFGFCIALVIFIIFNKTRVITRPIKKLVENVNKIAEGNLGERANIEGNLEIMTLSQHFNMMLEKIESFYNELEQKVIERTAEIQRQKHEIEEQRDELAEQHFKLEKAYGKIEEQNKHITDSIIYAKRIQTAILPPDTHIRKLMPDSFILYLPKDIVSGDFYWITKKSNLVFVSAVDCTGHGVPGAFMSIVGNDQLNSAVNVKGARTPAEILNCLNEGVSETLRQNEGTNSVKDGMDLSLCAIDYKNMKLQFAGAKNPIYIVRGEEMIVVKGDRYAIGTYAGNEHQGFTNNEMDLQRGDVVYLFSDGYADQFGGKDNRKFMYKNFRELLSSIASKDMEEQKNILEQTIYDWRGDRIQVDDILVIGIRIS